MANKQLTIINGQTVTLQCKATYEGKNAIDKVSALASEVVTDRIAESFGAELNADGEHIDIFIKGTELGSASFAIPFGYNGKESGVEGVDVSTVNLDLTVKEPTLILTPPDTPAVFQYDPFLEFDLPVNISDGTEQIILNDPGISFQETQAMVDIITVGIDMIMIKPNAGWNPEAGTYTGTLKIFYYTASVDVEYTFVVPEPRTLKATVEGGIVNPFTNGEKKLTITDNTGAPVTDATLVSVNVSNERDAKNVHSYIAQYLRAIDAPNGIYAFDYSSLYNGAKTTLKFKVASGNEEFELNPVVVEFKQQPYEVVMTPDFIPKVSSATGVDVSINLKRTANGVATPVTGIWEPLGPSSGSTYSSVPTMPSQMRIRTFRLLNIPKTNNIAMLLQIRFTDTENNGEPTSLLLQFKRLT